MSNDIYNADILAPTTTTITIDDDGIGLDWLVVNGSYPVATDIRLSWWNVNGVSTQASARFDPVSGQGHRLVINGLIENVRGSISADFIQGNEVANILFGDAASTGPGGDDTLSGFDGNDTIYGGAGDDSVGGGNGNDRLFGNNGADTLYGGAGQDTLVGGAGADVMTGGADGNDYVSYIGSLAGVVVQLTFGSTTTAHGGDAEGDTLNGINAVNGSNLNDTITDTVLTNSAFGYNANQFFGNAGNDRLNLGGSNDLGAGGGGNDTIYAGQGNDTLQGGAGVDFLSGGLGRDIFSGGLDADRFVFSTKDDSPAALALRDVIQDFTRAQGDKIDLRGIDADSTLALNQAFVWRGTAGFTGHHGDLREVAFGTGWAILGDLNGDKVADFGITVNGPSGMLIATDFLL